MGSLNGETIPYLLRLAVDFLALERVAVLRAVVLLAGAFLVTAFDLDLVLTEALLTVFLGLFLATRFFVVAIQSPCGSLLKPPNAFSRFFCQN